MITVRKSKDRGHAQHGWLDSRHTFSFSDYYDPQFTGFQDLVVINEDRVEGGKGFGRHGHNDMEIISYVLEGQLEHKDSMGTGSVLSRGDVQRMSAGSGVQHSEFNHLKDKIVHFLQIWITPEKMGIKPSYEEKNFSTQDKKNKLKLIASPNGEGGSLTLHQKVKLYASELERGQTVSLNLSSGRYGWVQVVRGTIDLNGIALDEGDGASISAERTLTFTAKKDAEFLVFDLSERRER